MLSPTVIDLFCGAGGMSEGLRQAGFRVVGANDFNFQAGETFRANHPEAAFFSGPVEDVTIDAILKGTGLSVGELDLLAGGPPCQSYSVYNHKRNLDDSRSKMYREYLRIVEGLQPKWIVMENVEGMLTQGARAAKAFCEGMAGLGYHVEYRSQKAEKFGVPQARRRVLFIGNRMGQPIVWPAETHGPGLRPYVTVAQAIGDLPELQNGGRMPAAVYEDRAGNSFQAAMRVHASAVENHSTVNLSAKNMHRMSFVKPGGSWRDIPFELLAPGMQTAKRTDHTTRYGRLTEDGLAWTILTKCDVHWGCFYHPTQERVISVREAARLQSIPDHVVFHGSITDQYIQVGNAVPSLLAKAIGLALVEAIYPMVSAA